MDSQTSRKLIVAGAMAAVIGIGVVIFALRHPVGSVAQTPQPPAPIVQTPAAPEAVAQAPAAPAVVAQAPAIPALVAHNDGVDSQGADTAAAPAEPKPAHTRHVARADASAVAASPTVTRTQPAAEMLASSDPVKSAEELSPPVAAGNLPADDQKVAASTDLAASDNQITADVKLEIAGDSLSKDVAIGVTTTQGVVALTGSLASQDAIDHVKEAAGKVKDVKSVDASGLVVASL
jgi:hyperosmotically inducible periplasmic protein